MRTQVKIAPLALAALVSLIAACAQQAKPTAPLIDPAEAQLVSAAQDVRTSLRHLAEAEQYSVMGRRPGAPELAPDVPGLDDVISLPWNGPLEQVVVRLASVGHYDVYFAGKAPAIPILVSLGSTPTKASQLLYDVGLQAGARADIVVDPARHKLGVVYANTGL